MRTVLDDAKTWFLERLLYGDEVCAILVEGFRGDKPEDIRIGEHLIKDAYALAPSGKSRKFVVRFSRPVAWQVVDESYTSFDKSEMRDDGGFLQALTRSAYLDYVMAHHGWFTDTVGPAKHYRLWTEDDVIDVVAHDAPVVEAWAGT